MDEEDSVVPETAESTGGSSRYKPGPQSELGVYLREMKSSILDAPAAGEVKKNHADMKKGRVWYPPEYCALCDIEPDLFRYSSSNAWVYLFDPLGDRRRRTPEPVG